MRCCPFQALHEAAFESERFFDGAVAKFTAMQKVVFVTVGWCVLLVSFWEQNRLVVTSSIISSSRCSFFSSATSCGASARGQRHSLGVNRLYDQHPCAFALRGHQDGSLGVVAHNDVQDLLLIFLASLVARGATSMTVALQLCALGRPVLVQM